MKKYSPCTVLLTDEEVLMDFTGAAIDQQDMAWLSDDKSPDDKKLKMEKACVPCLLFLCFYFILSN